MLREFVGEFDWYGNHTICIIGAINSGKTVLLTSLLWHLKDHNKYRFNLEYGNVLNFKLIEYHDKEHNFDFKLHKKKLVYDHKWPNKTMDYAVAECKYRYSYKLCLCERHVTFVDIPGERVADMKAYRQAVELDVSPYPNGIYIVHVRCLSKHYYSKFIIKH